MRVITDPWEAYKPAAANAWDLRKAAHLHRRAGFGATWSELQRDLRDGPAASVNRLLNPRALSMDEQQVLDTLRQGVLDAHDADRMKAWWLYRILYDPDPLREKMTLFWHGHFATAIEKGGPFMLQQNQLFRSMALGNFKDLLKAVLPAPVGPTMKFTRGTLMAEFMSICRRSSLKIPSKTRSFVNSSWASVTGIRLMVSATQRSTCASSAFCPLRWAR